MNILSVQVSPRRTMYVSFEDDTFPNRGGYFCQIWQDANKEFFYGSFTINRRQLLGADDKGNLARKLAIEKTKYLCK